MSSSSNHPGSGTTVRNPNVSTAERAAAPLTTASEKVDPWPHYIMAMACAGASGYAYQTMKNPRAAAIAAGIAALYSFAGYSITEGNPRMGYDVGVVASAALLGTAGSRALATGELYSSMLTAVGGVSGLGNLLKAYQERTGRPRSIEVEHK